MSEAEATSALSREPLPNPYTISDVQGILGERGCLISEAPDERTAAWIAAGTAMLGPHAADRATLGDLLGLCFEYDARNIMRAPATHTVLAREGARAVIRELAFETIAGGPVDSDRFRAMIEAIKTRIPYRSRLLLHPIRLALTGRAGEGELDRVILLLDAASGAAGLAPVKTVRQRILEFCAALD